MVYHTSGGTLLTADEFLMHPAANERTELVRGHIRMMTPSGLPHGLVSGNVFRLLSTHVRQHRLGVCFADSTGYTLPNLPNTVRAPDASFVRGDRLPPEGISGGFAQLAPDLAVEVLSPASPPPICRKSSPTIVRRERRSCGWSIRQNGLSRSLQLTNRTYGSAWTTC